MNNAHLTTCAPEETHSIKPQQTMSITRAASEAALKHVISTVLDYPDDGPLAKTLAEAGCAQIHDFIACAPEEHADMTCKKDDGSEGKLAVHVRNRVKAFQHCAMHRHNAGNAITDYQSVTQEEFDTFRISPAFIAVQHGLAAPAAAGTKDPVSEFKKGIKRDPSLFEVLKDEKQWDTWQRSAMTMARSQGVEDVLNASCVPPAGPPQALFQEKQKYMYSVLQRTLRTDEGKSIVRDHENDFNAQQVFIEIKACSEKSTKSSLESSELLSCVTTTRFAGGDWKGSARSFILHWENQVRLYEKQSPTGDHLSEGQKRMLLENSVHDCGELRAVKTQADQHKAHDGTELTCEQHVNLLKSAAATCDQQFRPDKRTSKARRTVCATEIDPEPDSTFDDSYCDIDSPVDVILANAAQRNRTPRNRPLPEAQVPQDRCRQLSIGDKSTWRQISEQGKALILGNVLEDTQPGLPPRSANLHQISACDFITANLHDLRIGSEGDVDDAAEDLSEFQDAHDGNAVTVNSNQTQ